MPAWASPQGWMERETKGCKPGPMFAGRAGMESCRVVVEIAFTPDAEHALCTAYETHHASRFRQMFHQKTLMKFASLLVTLTALAVTTLVPFTAVAAPAPAASGKKLKVFILAGQSNMQGHANVATLDYIGDDPATAPILKEMRGADGKARVCDKVWISSVGCAGDDTTEQTGRLTSGFGASTQEIGPEFTFGIYMEKQLGEPILLIKTSWGGKSLNTDFRPPSAGPYAFNEVELENIKKQGGDLDKKKADKAKVTGHYYHLMINHVARVLKDIKRVYPAYNASQGYELAGLVWFQGFNDLVAGDTYPHRYESAAGYAKYGEWMADFIRDVRKDLAAPKLPFVIGVMGIGGPIEQFLQPRYKGVNANFRAAMAAPALLPEFKGNVIAVQTAPFWPLELEKLAEKKDRTPAEEALSKRGASNGGYHYLGCAKTMAQIGKAFAEALANPRKTLR